VVDGDFVAGVAGYGTAEAPAMADIFSMPEWPSETFGAAAGAIGDVGGDGVPVGEFLLVMITFLFVDIFDTAGTKFSMRNTHDVNLCI
jgi:AGZA family xanthine/uracil permease-like MFS transporter